MEKRESNLRGGGSRESRKQQALTVPTISSCFGKKSSFFFSSGDRLLKAVNERDLYFSNWKAKRRSTTGHLRRQRKLVYSSLAS
uniref:Uncharacterized protein n=1 Tax=Daphnia galeata TaxID=27404 RepID=A0A8J2S0D5_9CRUS|nr:unnamed protein product [Daphnia galeata]